MGVPNVSDSIYAIKELVYEQNKYSLTELEQALGSNWDGKEIMRQHFLNIPKFGNDESGADEMAVMVSEQIRKVLESKQNNKGFCFRPSLFQIYGTYLCRSNDGATPDGRKQKSLWPWNESDAWAHRNGIGATVNSFTKLDFSKYQGGSFQIELTPDFFKAGVDKDKMMEAFSAGFFQKGGVQINFNLVDLEVLGKSNARQR